MVEPSGSLKVIFKMPVPVLYEEDIRVGGMPSVTTIVTVVWAMSLPVGSATAPPETVRVMVSPTVVRWVALRVAVRVSPEWFLVETSSSATLPFSPASTIPE